SLLNNYCVGNSSQDFLNKLVYEAAQDQADYRLSDWNFSSTEKLQPKPQGKPSTAFRKGRTVISVVRREACELSNEHRTCRHVNDLVKADVLRILLPGTYFAVRERLPRINRMVAILKFI
ncbi:hypothetical protein Trydic_g12003, partial [Trypoxylus dichotomus]